MTKNIYPKLSLIPPQKYEIGSSRKRLFLYKASLFSLSSVEKEVAIGCLLGDASIQTQDGGKTYRLKFLQGASHIDYLKFCAQIFKRWVLSEPVSQDRLSKDGRLLKAYRFQTISHKAFVPLARLFLNSEGKKVVVPGCIQNHLTPRGFAFWLMDDGGRTVYNKGSSFL